MAIFPWLLVLSALTLRADHVSQLVRDDECASSTDCALAAVQLHAVKGQEERSNISSNSSGLQHAALEEHTDVSLPMISQGPEARYSKEQLVKLLELHQQRMNSSERWGGTSSSSHMAQPFNLASSCYSFTGGTCAFASCSSFRMAQCQAGKCMCPGGCAGADGRCYNSPNLLVASSFVLTNVQYPSYRMYFKRITTWGQMGTSSMPSFSFMGSDLFDLYRVPGLFNGKALFIIASHKWPSYVLAGLLLWMEVELGPAGPAAWQRQLVMDPMQRPPAWDPMQRPPAWARPSAFAAPPLPFNAPLQVETEAPRDEARQSFLDLGHDGRHGHRVPWRQYVSLAVWYLLLVMEYIVVRIVCQFDIPRDCKPHGNLDTIFDLQVMFMMGFMLAILTGVHMPDRFAYLFCFKGPRPRGIAFLLVMVVSGPVWGSLDTIDSLSRISFTSSFFEESFVNVLIGLAFGAAAAFLLLWHFYCAFMHNQISGFLAYTGSRLSIWIFYGVYLYIAATTTNVEVHLHHYVIGFLIAILAEFNHPISLVVLAAGTGIFVQGISAYHADALTEEKKHLLALFF